MPTECSAEKFEFGEVSGRVVVAGFDGGAITSDAGALLLGATDRAVRLTERFAACFTDRRAADHVEQGLSGISCVNGIMGRKGDPYGTTESTGDPGRFAGPAAGWR